MSDDEIVTPNVEQATLAGVGDVPEWAEKWAGMPEYAHKDERPHRTLLVHFRNKEDATAFAQLVGQELTKSTKSIWYPRAEIRRAADKVWTGAKLIPRYPIYIISKSRWESRLTSKCLEWIGAPYRIVVEPQEYEHYASVIDPAKILVTPFSNLGQGGIPARNFVWEHAVATGAARHWILDDNIAGFCRFQDNLKVELDNPASICAVEDWVDRYENVVMAGFNYDYFAPRKFGAKIKPITFNTRVYSGILLSNAIPHRWRGRYNEDTDLSLRILKDGYCTALFNAFLMYKMPTLTMKGGNTDELYAGVEVTAQQWAAHAEVCRTCARCLDGYGRDDYGNPVVPCQIGRDILEGDGRWRMAEHLREQHPDVVTVERKWGRWQHQVDYRAFRHNELLLRPDAEIPSEDPYGLKLDAMPADPPAQQLDSSQRRVPPVVEATTSGGGTAPTQAATEPEAPQVRSLAELIGAEPPRVESGWVPDEPPSLSSVDEITLNFETNGLRWWEGHAPISVTVGTLDGKLCRFLPFGFTGGNLDRERVVEWLRREVRGKRITNANAKFEVHMARNLGVDLEEQGCTVSDVQHYAALLDDSRKKFNLDLLAGELLGGSKVPRVDESRMPTYHASEVAARARYQVQLVAELRAAMWPKLDAEDLQRVRQLEDDVIYPVCEMERNGVPLDLELLERWVKESAEQYESCLMTLYKETGQSINPNAPSDLEKLFNHLGLPVVRLESGAPSFTDAIMSRIDHPLVQQVRFAVKLSDLRSRYLLKYQKTVGSDGVLRYSMNQLRYQKDSGEEGGSGPGRFSSSELDRGVGCNIQQVIKVAKQRRMFGYSGADGSHDDAIYIIRRLAVPREGQWLCADAEQIEYRMFAHYAENPRVIQAYKDDPRVNFHALTMGLMRPHVRSREYSYDDSKTYNFATIYGAAQVKQATMLGFITDGEAAEIRARQAWNDPRLAPMKAIIAVYDRLLPEVKPLIKRAASLAQTRGYVKTLMGRRSRFTIDKRFHKALNNVLQGGAADYNKVKLVEVHRERKHTGFLLRVSVHDEMDGDARHGEETLKRIREVLDHQSWPEMKVPLLWDVKLGANWAEAK